MLRQEPLQLVAAVAVPRITDCLESLQASQIRQLDQRQATQPIVTYVEVGQTVRQGAQRPVLDLLDVAVREDQLAQRHEIAEPMGGRYGQPVADERETLQLVQTGERARLDRVDRAVAQFQAAQTVAEAEEHVRGQSVDPQSRDLDPRGLVRQTVQRRQDARLEVASGTLLPGSKRKVVH